MTPDEIVSFLTEIEQTIEEQIGELQMTLTLVREKKEHYAPPLKSAVKLEVPWLSQLGVNAAFAPGDCGTADVAMVLRYYGLPVTVDQVSSATGKPRGFKLLGFDDLIRAAASWNVRLAHQVDASLDMIIADLNDGKPVIALVDYKSLPATTRFDSGYAFGHYVVCVGYDAHSIIYHDPYWVDRTGGANRSIARAEFERAFGTIAAGNQHSHQVLRVVTT